MMRLFAIRLWVVATIIIVCATGSVLAQVTYAADQLSPGATTAGFVDWATVASAFGAMLLLLGGACLAHINSQITKLSDTLWERVVNTEQQLETLHRTLLREYHTKADLREMLDITMRPFMEKLTSLSGDMDAVYRELLRTNKHEVRPHGHIEKSHN